MSKFAAFASLLTYNVKDNFQKSLQTLKFWTEHIILSTAFHQAKMSQCPRASSSRGQALALWLRVAWANSTKKGCFRQDSLVFPNTGPLLIRSLFCAYGYYGFETSVIQMHKRLHSVLLTVLLTYCCFRAVIKKQNLRSLDGTKNNICVMKKTFISCAMLVCLLWCPCYYQNVPYEVALTYIQ